MVGVRLISLLSIGSLVSGTTSGFFVRYINSPAYVSQCESLMLPGDHFSILTDAMSRGRGSLTVLEDVLARTYISPVRTDTHLDDYSGRVSREMSRESLHDDLNINGIEMGFVRGFKLLRVPIRDFIVYSAVGTLRAIQSSISGIWSIDPIPESPVWYSLLNESVNLQLYSLWVSVNVFSACTDLICRVWREILTQVHYRVVVGFARQQWTEFPNFATDIESILLGLILQSEDRLARIPLQNTLIIPETNESACCCFWCLICCFRSHRHRELPLPTTETSNPEMDLYISETLAQLVVSYKAELSTFKTQIHAIEVKQFSEQISQTVVEQTILPFITKTFRFVNPFLIYGERITLESIQSDVYTKSERLVIILQNAELYATTPWMRVRRTITLAIDALDAALPNLNNNTPESLQKL